MTTDSLKKKALTKRGHFHSLFVTFEGIDGCGKSTHAAMVYRYLIAHGYKYVKLFREPGSTKVAERIRGIVLDGRLTISGITEVLLYEAARAALVEQEIRPALAQGNIVLCDRFYDSTTAYQGFGRKLDLRMVRSLHKVAVGKLVPDLTFVFDLDPKVAATRRDGAPDRLEAESLAFHNRVRSGFLEIARKERRRVKVIDGTLPIEAVFAEVLRYLLRKLRSHAAADH
jgi:dTMP kinase